MVKARNFKFGRHVPWDSPHMTLKNFTNRRRCQGQVTPVNFLALNANCSNMAKDTDFKFEEHIPWDTPNRSPLKFYRKWGVARVT